MGHGGRHSSREPRPLRSYLRRPPSAVRKAPQRGRPLHFAAGGSLRIRPRPPPHRGPQRRSPGRTRHHPLVQDLCERRGRRCRSRAGPAPPSAAAPAAPGVGFRRRRRGRERSCGCSAAASGGCPRGGPAPALEGRKKPAAPGRVRWHRPPASARPGCRRSARPRVEGSGRRGWGDAGRGPAPGRPAAASWATGKGHAAGAAGGNRGCGCEAWPRRPLEAGGGGTTPKVYRTGGARADNKAANLAAPLRRCVPSAHPRARGGRASAAGRWGPAAFFASWPA
jgi:hypothetical protein